MAILFFPIGNEVSIGKKAASGSAILILLIVIQALEVHASAKPRSIFGIYTVG